MTIDKDGLAAAAIQLASLRGMSVADEVDQAMFGADAAKVVTAYLSALPDTGDELVARLREERDSWRRVAERCKSEAEGHAMEARTANSTIYEIYQVLSGATGEPGNWHGAEPARQYVAKAEASLASAREALEQIATGRDKDGLKVDFPADIAATAIRALKEVQK